MTSSEAPDTFHQPGLAGSRCINDMKGGDLPLIKGLYSVLLLIQKTLLAMGRNSYPPLPRTNCFTAALRVANSLTAGTGKCVSLNRINNRTLN